MKSAEIIGNDHERESAPLIKAESESSFWLAVFDFAFYRMIKKGFFSVRIKNAQNFELRDHTKSNIMYASHCCWWDGMIAYILCRKVLKTRMHMMIEELFRFPLLSKIGAFSVEKNSPQSAIRALNYSLKILQDPANTLWIFPQGTVLPQDYRPVKFASGVSYLCKKTNGANLIPIAHRYNFIREDRPEVLIEIGKPIILNDNSINRKELTEHLEREFVELLDKQRNDIAQGKLDKYEFYYKNRLCVAKLIEKHFTNFVRTFNT